MRTLIDRFRALGDLGFEKFKLNPPNNIVIILVNAEIESQTLIENTADKPSAATTLAALTNSQMSRNNEETTAALLDSIEDFNGRNRAAGLPTRIYFPEVSFKHPKVEQVRQFLNRLSTSLKLEDQQVDRLIGAGRWLLRNEASFERFKRDNRTRMAEGALTEKQLCHQFDEASCARLRPAAPSPDR